MSLAATTTQIPNPALETPDAPTAPPATEAVEPCLWMINADDGSVTSGYLPEWAQEDPTAHGVPAGQLPGVLADITHWVDFDGTFLRAHTTESGETTGAPADTVTFASSIMCHPFPDADDDPRLPFAEVQITPDCWMTGLDPDALTTLTATLRTIADRIENDVQPLLLKARTDWVAHRRTSTSA